MGVPQTTGCMTAYQALNIIESFDIFKLPGRAQRTPIIFSLKLSGEHSWTDLRTLPIRNLPEFPGMA